MSDITTVHTNPSTGLSIERSMNRRHLLKIIGFGTAALALGTASVAERAGAQDSAERHTSHAYTVTTAANFRTGPGTNHSIISVISSGATFTLNGQTQNGYTSVTYQGRSGWVLASIVVEAGSTGADPVISGEARTTTDVNLRSGPSTSNQVLRIVPSGATIGVSSTVQNGFRYVSHQGLTGWMADAYIGSGSGNGDGGSQPDPTISGEAWTITAVNLRSGPSTSNQVLRVVPTDAKIGVSTTVQNGFRYVSYQGQAGWMADAYISFSNGNGNGGPVPAYQTTTADLNLRAEPSLSAKVLLVMPTGSKVTPNGALSNNFAQVKYNGTTGWASIDYLQ